MKFPFSLRDEAEMEGYVFFHEEIRPLPTNPDMDPENNLG